MKRWFVVRTHPKGEFKALVDKGIYLAEEALDLADEATLDAHLLPGPLQRRLLLVAEKRSGFFPRRQEQHGGARAQDQAQRRLIRQQGEGRGRSQRRDRRNAALMSPTWLYVCGKLPH